VRLGPGRLETYILSHTATGVAISLANISLIILLVCFVELSRAFGGRSDVGLVDLLQLLLLQAPSIILLLLPFVFLFGVLAAFVTMNRRSELVAMRAAGVSAWRFIFPAAAMAFLIGIANVTALNPLAAALNGRFEDVKSAIAEGRAKPTAAGFSEIWLRQGDAHTQIVIHAREHDIQNGVVRLQGVSLFLQTVDAKGALRFSRRIEAAEARLERGYWRLKDVRESTPGAEPVRWDSLSIPSPLDRRTAMEKFAIKDAVGFWSLPATIQHADAAGFSPAPYELRFNQLLATPVMFAAMSVLAAAFSLRLARLGGLAGLALAGVALGFLVFFFDRLCAALGAAEVIPPILAGWAPSVLALLGGVILLCYTEDG